MARPAKSIAMQADGTAMTKAEHAARTQVENELRGAADKLVPPDWFDEGRAAIFNELVSELEDRNILGNLDYWILVKCSTAIDMLAKIDYAIDEDPLEIHNTKLRGARQMYSQDFFKCCSELCLSPSSRAKVAIQKAENKKKPLTVFGALEDDDDGFED